MATETRDVKLKTGDVLPLFSLAAVNGGAQTGPGQYKQHRNLVLIFFHSATCQQSRQLLSDITSHYGEYREKETQVLAISADDSKQLQRLARELALPFPLLTDINGKVTKKFLKYNAAPAGAAVFIADRWGAIFAKEVFENDNDLLAEAEIRKWLEFIEIQCEECFPPEWPQ